MRHADVDRCLDMPLYVSSRPSRVTPATHGLRPTSGDLGLPSSHYTCVRGGGESVEKGLTVVGVRVWSSVRTESRGLNVFHLVYFFTRVSFHFVPSSCWESPCLLFSRSLGR